MIVLSPSRGFTEDKVFSREVGNAVLLELYTSEGCDSCPPAEKYFQALAKTEGLFSSVFPLVFHVNYWDYLGWKDVWADEQHTQRQRALANLAGRRTIYTPGVYANGKTWSGWRKANSASQQNMGGKLELKVTGNEVKAHYDLAEGAPSGQRELYLVALGMGLKTKISRGERTGESVSHDFVVLNYQKQAVSKKKSSFSTTFAWAPPFRGQAPKALVAWVTLKDKGQPEQVVGGYL